MAAPRMNSVPNPMFSQPGPPPGQYGVPGQPQNMPAMGQTGPYNGPPKPPGSAGYPSMPPGQPPPPRVGMPPTPTSQYNSLGGPGMGPPPASQYNNAMGPPPATQYNNAMGPPPASQYNNTMGPPPATQYNNTMGPPPATQYNGPGMGPAPVSPYTSAAGAGIRPPLPGATSGPGTPLPGGASTGPLQRPAAGTQPGMQQINRTPPPPSSMPASSAHLPRNYSAPTMSQAGMVNGVHAGRPVSYAPTMNGPPSAGAPSGPPPTTAPPVPGVYSGGGQGHPPPPNMAHVGARPPGPGFPHQAPPRPGAPPSGYQPSVGMPPTRPPLGPPPSRPPGQPPGMAGDRPGAPPATPPAMYAQNYGPGGMNGPQGLPAPFHGQANYSHQLHENAGHSEGPTPAHSASHSQRSSANPSPVTAMQYDTLEGQFSPERSQPSSPQQYNPNAPASPPGQPGMGPPGAGITGRRQYPQMPGAMPPPASSMGYQHQQQMGNYSQAGGGAAGYSQPGAPQYPQAGANSYMQNNVHPNNMASLGSDFSGMKLHETRPINLLQERHLIPPQGVETMQANLPHDYKKVNCNPDLFRCTLTTIPKTQSLLSKSRLPLGILIHPFRDLSQLPVIQSSVIVRCRLCRTYINPFVTFTDMRRWKCNLCSRVNELPDEFNYDPVSKTYGEPQRRPEIRSSTIEFIAPSEYMLRPPQPAVYLYVLDVSFNAVQSGYLQVFCQTLQEEIERIPGDARTQIGFITFDRSLHFYNLSEGLSQPFMMVVSDVDEIFLPSPDGLLVNLHESKELVIDLLDRLPVMFEKNTETASCLGAALQSAYKLMNPTGGRVSVFQTLLPTVGPGALKNREDSNERSGKHIQHLGPATDFYKKLALECSAQQIAVDLFLMSSQYADLASIGCISKYSGGCMHHFPTLHTINNPAERERFRGTLHRYFTRKIGLEAVMRIRCTRGLSIHTFHGNFFVRSTDLLSLPNINPDAGFGMHMAIEDDLEGNTACFQAALLYTSSKGERRIRVHTLCVPITNNLSEVHAGADQLAIVGMLAKMGVDKSVSQSMSDAREAMINASLDMLKAYGGTLNSSQRLGQLPIINTLRCVPLYIMAMLKYTGFRINASTRLDDRVACLEQCKTLPLQYLLMELYPHLYPIHALQDYAQDDGSDEPGISEPPLLQLSCANMDRHGAYLMDTGSKMYLYICSAVSDAFCQSVLGLINFQAIPDGMAELPELENPSSQRMHAFINHLNDQRPYPAALYIIREDSRLKIWFLQHMVEDRTESSMSYYEFLQSLQKDVK